MLSEIIVVLVSWNNFIGPQIVLQESSALLLSEAMNQLRGRYGTEYGLVLPGALISIASVLARFLLSQKEFISGLTSGAVKGGGTATSPRLLRW